MVVCGTVMLPGNDGSEQRLFMASAVDFVHSCIDLHHPGTCKQNYCVFKSFYWIALFVLTKRVNWTAASGDGEQVLGAASASLVRRSPATSKIIYGIWIRMCARVGRLLKRSAAAVRIRNTARRKGSEIGLDVNNLIFGRIDKQQRYLKISYSSRREKKKRENRNRIRAYYTDYVWVGTWKTPEKYRAKNNISPMNRIERE